MSVWLKWDITYKCNLFCQHCINGNYLDKKSDDITFTQFKTIIDNIQRTIKVDGINFLGGEPILHKDFIQILKYLNEIGVVVNFNSNGLGLTKERLNEILCLDNISNIVLSLDGPDKETNDQIRGRSVFDMMVSRINYINEYKKAHTKCNANIQINYVATNGNADKINEMIDFCINNKIKKLCILEYIEEGNGVGKHLTPTREQILEMIKTIAFRYSNGIGNLQIEPRFVRPMAIDYVNKVLHLEFPVVEHGCGVGFTYAFLNNKGYIYPCDRTRNLDKNLEYKYSLLEQEFGDVWATEDFSKPFSQYYSDDLYTKLYPCNNCKYLKDYCYPCYLLIDKNRKAEMTLCKYMEDEIRRCLNETK